jgi:hypothetical protein
MQAVSLENVPYFTSRRVNFIRPLALGSLGLRYIDYFIQVIRLVFFSRCQIV